MTAVLAQVHKATAAVAQDDDIDFNLDPALAACVPLGLAGPHLAPPPGPAARPPPASACARGGCLRARRGDARQPAERALQAQRLRDRDRVRGASVKDGVEEGKEDRMRWSIFADLSGVLTDAERGRCPTCYAI